MRRNAQEELKGGVESWHSLRPVSTAGIQPGQLDTEHNGSVQQAFARQGIWGVIRLLSVARVTLLGRSKGGKESAPDTTHGNVVLWFVFYACSGREKEGVMIREPDQLELRWMEQVLESCR